MNINSTLPGRAYRGLLSALLAAFALPPNTEAASQRWAPGRLLIQTKAGFSSGAFDALLNSQGARFKRRLKNLDTELISVPAGDEDKIARLLARHPHIKFVEKDMRVPMQFVPNDPIYPKQWHLAKIQAPAAWDMSAGNGITVAVLDTGVDASHPDLAPRLVPGWNAVNGGNDTRDINGHGTAVAGTVVTATNNGYGVASVAWAAKLMPIRITNDSTGYAYWSDIANGVIWAADHGAKVVNVSYGVSNSAAITSAAQYLRGKGGLLVSAAMNESAYLSDPDNPYIITVSATDYNDAKTSWSNYGPSIDVAAPGLYIPTTMRGNLYGSWSGTSFASPIAAGVIAMIMQTNPTLVPDQVERVLEQSADDPTPGVDFDPKFGHGRVNAAKAVLLAANTLPLDTQPPTASITAPSANSTVKGLVPVTVAASDKVGVTQVVLYAGGQQVGVDTVAPYQFSWDSSLVADGSVTLSAEAYDAAGNKGLASPVTVNVDNIPNTLPNLPTISFASPADNSVVSGTVPVSIKVADSAKVTRISLYIDGALRAMNSNSTSMVYNWNTQSLASGKHILKATANDANGKTGELSITVKR